MKKIVTLLLLLVTFVSVNAQLQWDTEFDSDDFQNALTVISKTDNVSFSNGILGIGGGLSIGKIIINPLEADFEDECVVALPQTGVAEKVYFSWLGGGTNGTVSVYQSQDHNNWSQVFSSEGTSIISTATADSATLATTTRFLKFAAKGRSTATFRNIRVSELKSLAVSTDEWPFGNAMVDDAPATKTVTINWTNIVATVKTTDPHFSVSATTVGQKNLINQSTTITVSYNHQEAGSHTGYVVVSGEGREARIKVSGSTEKYSQTLTWSQTLTECLTTDKVELTAHASSGLAVGYESSDPSIAVVKEGVLEIYAAGTITLTASQEGNYKFLPAENTISKDITINKATPVVAPQAEILVYGQAVGQAKLEDTIGEVAGTFSYIDVDPNIILPAGDYVFSVLFTPENENIYNSVTSSVALHIDKAPQTIVWDAQQSNLVVGEAVASTATLSSGLDIVYAYTSCILSIENGLIVPENEGEVSVVAYHPGNENYLPTTVIVKDFVISDGTVSAAPVELTDEQISNARKYLKEGKVFIDYQNRTYDANGRLIFESLNF